MLRFQILSILLLACTACDKPGNKQAEVVDLRLATFNIAMGLEQEGQLGQALAHGERVRL